MARIVCRGGASHAARMKIIACILFALLAGTAAAAYPERPLKLVVSSGPGSVSDVRARWLAARLAPALGQPVVVENIGGGSGFIGSRAVARSAPDGYTLLLAHMGNMITAPYVVDDLGYDPAKDFAPVSRISTGYGVLTCNPQFPARSVAELVRYAKDKPGAINWGNTGIGGPPWMSGELFQRQARIEVTNVQYKGGGELMQDLLAGRIDCWIEGALIQTPHIKAGKLRPLATTSPARLPFLPEVPTMAEAGLPDYEFQGWTGIVVRAGTPRPVIDKLNAEMRKILATRESIDWFADQANVPVQETPEEFAAFLAAQSAKWIPIIRSANLK